jgi:hypothetical protein
MGALAARRGGERGREGEMEESGGERKGGRQAVSSCLQLRWAPHEPTWSGSKLMGAQAHSTRFHVSSPLSAVVFRVGAGDPTAG